MAMVYEFAKQTLVMTAFMLLIAFDVWWLGKNIGQGFRKIRDKVCGKGADSGAIENMKD